jgi:hypothetical protein
MSFINAPIDLPLPKHHVGCASVSGQDLTDFKSGDISTHYPICALSTGEKDTLSRSFYKL